jgi:hypothetical protein
MPSRSNAWIRGWILKCTGLAILWTSALGQSRSVADEPQPPLSPAEKRLKADVSYLAHDDRDGRGPGTPGIEAAASYIAGMFQGIGLKPAPGADGYFQPFKINGPATIRKPAELTFFGPEGKTISTSKGDLTPLALGIGGTIAKAPIVFAGYGITAKDERKHLDYDDYKGLDAKGKVVLVLRREPQQNDEDSSFDGKRSSEYATFRHKATNAFQNGAAALILVNDLAGLNGAEDKLLAFRAAGNEANSTLPVIMITRAKADELLAEAGKPSLESLEKAIDKDLKPQSFALDSWKADATVDIVREDIQTKNVVGVLEGAGPLADETIVIGAHYDHLGHGGMLSGSLAIFSKDIHNGADDNASGTSMMMEMARRLAKRADPLPRRVVFMAFSGEERGLLGSSHYTSSPLFPLDKTVMMVNFDMVGRLNAKSEVTVYGTGTSPGFDKLVESLGASEGFKIKKISEGFGPSDQQSFYVKDIPVLFIFTGTHSDYHRPSDDTERINFPGMGRIADFGEVLLLDLVRRPERPPLVKMAMSHGSGSDPGRLSVSAYLGSIPDYNEDIKGVKLNGVREGSPAEKGGLKKDDVVIRFGGKPIGTIYDYTDSLARYKPGDSVEVVVKRDGKDVALQVVLGTKPTD